MEDLSYVQKGAKTVNGQYTFASHDQVTKAVHPMLVKYGVVITPSADELTQEGNRTVVKLCVVFTNADDPTDRFASMWYGYGVDPGDKGPGKAISYAYKYALLKTFALETGDDPDNDSKAVYEPSKPVYEASKCLEFEMRLPSGMSARDREKLTAFLEHTSARAGIAVEDIKREALTRFDEFMAAFKKWNNKKKEQQ